MQCFQNILVGVDLTRCRRLETSELSALMKETIDHAIWLARLNNARLLFFAVLNMSEEALHHLKEEERTHVRRTVEEQANRVLADLVHQAEQEGVEASGKLMLGKAWREIIRQVLRAGHDLVVVGTREVSGLRRMLFGNTAVKLMRRRPCPVWVTKPGHGSRPLNTLIATDLRPVSDTALRLGMSLGGLMGGPVHVLHVLEYPLDYLWSTSFPDAETTQYHRRVRAAAEQDLRRQLDKLDGASLASGFHVHLIEGAGVPDVAIQHAIHIHHIDLLVMGTIGRGGVVGIMIGNTAERLLPEVQCSVLAVKPPDFQSPIQLEAKE